MILRVIFFTVLFHVAFSSMRITTSLDALAHGAEPTQVGILISLIAFFPMFLSMPCGRWIDTAGARKPVLLGAALLLTGASIPSVFPTSQYGLYPLYISCITNGIGFMAIHMVSQQLVGYLSNPKNRTTSFAWLALGFSCSGLISPVLSGYIIDTVGHRWTFALALIFASCGLLLFLLVNTKLPCQWQSIRAKRDSRHPFALLRIPRVRNVLLVSSLVSMAWDLQNFMFPVYGHAIGLSASQIGWLIGTFFSATFVVRFFMPFMSRHLSEWQFLTLTLGVGAFAYALFPLFHSFEPLLVVAFILGLGLGASQPNVMSLLHSQTPTGRVGEALGIRTMLMNTSHSVLPSLFGAISTALGVFSIFLTMACVMGSASVLSVFRNRTGETDAAASEPVAKETLPDTPAH